jgi:hypothetical protein
MYFRSPRDLAGFNLSFINYFAGLMGIETKTVLSSSLRVRGEKSERLAEIVATLGADTYLSGLVPPRISTRLPSHAGG